MVDAGAFQKGYPWVYAIIANKSLRSLQRLVETPRPSYRPLSAFKRVPGLVYRYPMLSATPPRSQTETAYQQTINLVDS